MKNSLHFLAAILIAIAIMACSGCEESYKHVPFKQSASDPDQIDKPERIDVIVRDAGNITDKFECLRECDRRCFGEICYDKCSGVCK